MTARSTANGQKYDRWGTRSTAQIQRARLSASIDRPVDRPNTESKALWSGRSTGRPAHCLARCAQTCARLLAQWTGRPTGSESLTLYIWAVDRAVDRSREVCYLYLGGRPCGRPDAPTVIFLTVGGRPAGRPQGCQISLTANFLFWPI